MGSGLYLLSYIENIASLVSKCFTKRTKTTRHCFAQSLEGPESLSSMGFRHLPASRVSMLGWEWSSRAPESGRVHSPITFGPVCGTPARIAEGLQQQLRCLAHDSSPR